MPPFSSYPPAHTVDEYIQHLTDQRGDIVTELRQLIQQTVPKATEVIQWAQPVYDLNGPLCFIKAFRTEVRLGFWRGDQLIDPKKILHPPTDRLRHAKFTKIEQIDHRYLRGLIKAAAALNREHGNPTKSRIEQVRKIPR